MRKGNCFNQKRAVNLPARALAKGFGFLNRIKAGKERLVRIVAMLTKLLMRFDPEQYRNTAPHYAIRA